MPFSAQQIKTARLHLQKSDPVMRKLLKQLGPFTARASLDRLGALVDSILSQQISTAAAETIKGRFRAAYQQRATEMGYSIRQTRWEVLVSFDRAALHTLGVSPQKAGYLIDLAEKVSRGVVDLPRINRLSDEDVVHQLIQVKGIGRWTAQMFLIFSLARMDILPTDDLGLRKAIGQQYSMDEMPTVECIHQIANPWRPYTTVATWYLWRSLENPASVSATD